MLDKPKRTELTQNYRLYTELLSKREDAESALRKDMFSTILKEFFQIRDSSNGHTDVPKRLLNLEMLAAHGFGLITPITWPEIALIWGYSISWAFLTDLAKLRVYRHFDMVTPRHQNFLKIVKQSLHHYAAQIHSGRPR
ncbi:MAG: hypothetical protein U9N58_01035 [Thermodesulfobacteriota bacterium]|nr:hypothetical protein [Thermodesulfobacteriota bacterium]